MPDEEPDEAQYDQAPDLSEVEVQDTSSETEVLIVEDDAQYGSWDPTSVQPTSDSPVPSSVAPGNDGGTREQTDVPKTVEFDPRQREPFTGLMFLGALKSKFTWLGHDFFIRTLKTDEVIETGMLIQDVIGTQGEPKAYQAAVLAAAIISVDGKELPVPLSDVKQDTVLQNRYEFIRKHWFPPTIDEVYTRYLRLEYKSMEVISAMGNRSG